MTIKHPVDSATIGDLVHGPAVVVESKTTLDAVAHSMGDLGIGLVVVMDNGSVAGVVSERDIIWAIARDAALDEVWAADVMSVDLITVEPSLPVVEAANLLASRNARHLLVLHGDNPGVVSMKDILARLTA